MLPLQLNRDLLRAVGRAVRRVRAPISELAGQGEWLLAVAVAGVSVTTGRIDEAYGILERAAELARQVDDRRVPAMIQLEFARTLVVAG